MGKFAFDPDAHSLITPEAIRRHNADEAAGGDAAELAARRTQLALMLEFARQGFAKGEAAASVVRRLAAQLHELRGQAAPAVWEDLIPAAQQHPVSEYLLQDPFTAWSFRKPRGYAGDAGLIDLIYRHPSVGHVVESASELGREIYAYTCAVDSSEAVRERRTILARSVDETAARAPGADVLAIACGHMRETELSQAESDGTLGRWTGLDQDPISVATVNANRADSAVSAVEGSVRGLLRDAYDLGSFDLVYAAGLYDYLTTRIAVRLTEKALALLKPGGSFLFANFSDELATDGYMETFMDWPLILRTGDDMAAIMRAAADGSRYDLDVFFGENRNIVYGRITRPAE
ncbi:class I SAM-dependent methyltransferase [Oricola thermophila]|uniref:Class I SAM-dependent methyltransferase n=1 Tax=Oricola thermophila TaxID=2742145 RepID=A0A6N1VDH4_9HYPH|nr:class I SAM-dependent methyltransferase [Oricola thermophila]QKV17077.1 class I SAM-dependent methyltransferase [Oricola thermophila]